MSSSTLSLVSNASIDMYELLELSLSYYVRISSPLPYVCVCVCVCLFLKKKKKKEKGLSYCATELIKSKA